MTFLHPCPGCNREVWARKAKMGKIVIAAHPCPHDRPCVGASIHMRGAAQRGAPAHATITDRRLYCGECADEFLRRA